MPQSKRESLTRDARMSVFGSASDSLDSGRDNRVRGMPGGPTRTLDPMEAIVSLQTFEGYWTVSDGLLGVIGIGKGQMETALSGRNEAWAQGLAREADMKMAMTACVLIFLRKKLSGERDTWDMMAEKARDWLSAAVGRLGIGVDHVEKTLEHLV
jgi:hypothetical protein